MNRQQRRASRSTAGKNRLTIVPVGFGGLCEAGDKIHPIEEHPFIYTVGCTDHGYPELIMVPDMPRHLEWCRNEGWDDDIMSADVLADILRVNLNALALYQRRRGRPLQSGEIHQNAVQNLVACVEIVAAPDGFELDAAIQKYGRNGYRAQRVNLLSSPEPDVPVIFRHLH